MKRFIWILMISLVLFCGCKNDSPKSSLVKVLPTAELKTPEPRYTQFPKHTENPKETAKPDSKKNTAEPKKNVRESENNQEEISDEPAYEEQAENQCTLSVRCDTVLANLDLLDEEKRDIIPQDGVIFEGEAEFEDGDSVFDVLQRELKSRKIHFEFNRTPAYNSTYIEGIANLYEFDCSSRSGWLYRVNGETPEISCSQYTVQNGDMIEILYTCDMGNDL